MSEVSRAPETPRWQLAVIYLALTALIWIVFTQTLRFSYVEYDDPNYVFDNPVVSAGLTTDGLVKAFTQPHARNWHPLTTLSHMLDAEFFGLNPGGHHFTNVLLHTLATLLLFSALQQMTYRSGDPRSLWLCAFIAAVFAIHPLRAESVAWISERKDVLSALFFALTLGAYTRYAAAPRRGRFAFVFLFFALGLLAKPMLVTLPVILLLLDYWPLQRVQKKTMAALVREKIPLFLLSMASAAATMFAQRHTVGYGEQISLGWRGANAVRSIFVYLGEMFWPTRLAAFYPQIDHLPAGGTLLALVGLIALTLFFWKQRRSRPYLFVGWLWYLGVLLPVLGLVPVGLQAHADRYTYLSQIGLLIAVVWLVGDWIKTSKGAQVAALSLGLAVVAALTVQARQQTATWRNTEALWSHALDVTANNEVASYNLAQLEMKRGDTGEAFSRFEKALRALPDAESPHHLSASLLHNNYGIALARVGRINDAAAQFRRAIELRPDFADAHTNLAMYLEQRRNLEEAVSHYEKAAAIPPEDVNSHLRAGDALVRANRPSEALPHYRRAQNLTTDAALKQKLQIKIDAADLTEEGPRIPPAK